MLWLLRLRPKRPSVRHTTRRIAELELISKPDAVVCPVHNSLYRDIASPGHHLPLRPVVVACKLPLALASVLSIAARAHAKSLHALWPIRAPTFLHSPAAPIRTPKANSDTSARQANTGTLLAKSRTQLYFSIIFRPHFCVFGHRAILSWD